MGGPMRGPMGGGNMNGGSQGPVGGLVGGLVNGALFNSGPRGPPHLGQLNGLVGANGIQNDNIGLLAQALGLPVPQAFTGEKEGGQTEDFRRYMCQRAVC